MTPSDRFKNIKVGSKLIYGKDVKNFIIIRKLGLSIDNALTATFDYHHKGEVNTYTNYFINNLPPDWRLVDSISGHPLTKIFK